MMENCLMPLHYYLQTWKNVQLVNNFFMKANFSSKMVPSGFGHEEEVIQEFHTSHGESLRSVQNTVGAMVKRKTRKSQLKGERQEDYIVDQNSRRFDATGEIIEDSDFIVENTGSKFQPEKKNANVLLNLDSEEYDILEDGSQGSNTLKSNQNFKVQEIKQANKIRVLDFKQSEYSGIESVKIVEEKRPNPNIKPNPSVKSSKSIPRSEYALDKALIFEQLPKGCTMQCQIHREKKSLSGMVEYHILLQDTKQHVMTVRKEGLWEYIFYLKDPNGSYIRIASLESTFLSNRFTLIRHQEKFSNATICYESNFLGLSGPRRMHIYLPKTQVPFKFLDQCYGDLNWREKIEKCMNKQAKWSDEEQSYVLSFKGKAKESSIKNFVITDAFQSLDKYFVIFGKAGAEVYNLDIEAPFSLVQGIAVAMTTFETKITCD